MASRAIGAFGRTNTRCAVDRARPDIAGKSGVHDSPLVQQEPTVPRCAPPDGALFARECSPSIELHRLEPRVQSTRPIRIALLP